MVKIYEDDIKRYREAFCDNLTELMGDKNLAQWCREHGIPHGTALCWLRKTSLPSVEYLAALAKKFGVSIDYLIGLAD
ncbi:MAG: helix-turn-helix domain-containing protein [Firmicutes bacterium]|nr:helix-turn-helix domain-containing protein [Bacillota bacterium]